MSSNHLSSNTLPPEASTQSRSVPIGSRASSQSEDAQSTISAPGYRKHSLGDILQNPGGTDAKRFKSSVHVPSSSQTGIQPPIHALADYDDQLRLLEQQNKKRRMMAQKEKEELSLNGRGGMIGISATGPASNSTNISTPLGTQSIDAIERSPGLVDHRVTIHQSSYCGKGPPEAFLALANSTINASTQRSRESTLFWKLCSRERSCSSKQGLG